MNLCGIFMPETAKFSASHIFRASQDLEIPKFKIIMTNSTVAAPIPRPIETFEEVVSVSLASGDFKPAWRKFVKTKFFVPVISPADADAQEFRLRVLGNPADGKPALQISEALETSHNDSSEDTRLLSGAEIINRMPPAVAISVVFRDHAFAIPVNLVDWLKRSMQAAQAAAAEKKRAQALAQPVISQRAINPQENATAPPARQSGPLDVTALEPRMIIQATLGLEFHVPGAWQETRHGKLIQLRDAPTNTRVEVSGFQRQDMPMEKWLALRLPTVTQDMPFLQQTGQSYPIHGSGWRDRIQAVATEYKGTFRGDSEESRYLICCYRTDTVLATFTITATSAVFEKQRELIKWLLAHVDFGEPVQPTERTRADRAAAGRMADDYASAPGIFGLSTAGRLGRARFFAYGLVLWVSIAVVGILAAVLMPNHIVMAGVLLAVGLLWMPLRLTILRMHDINRSGKWLLALLLAPGMAGAMQRPDLILVCLPLVWLSILVMSLWPGTDDDNAYGSPCPPNPTWVLVAVVIFILLQVVGLINYKKVIATGRQSSQPWGANVTQAGSMAFSPADRSFTVNLPGKPQEVEMPEATLRKAGLAAMHIYTLDTLDEKYFIQVADFPVEPDDRSIALDRVRDNFMRRDRAVLVWEKLVRVDGKAGRDVRIGLPTGSNQDFRFLFIGTRLYVAMIQTSKADESSPRIASFLESFHAN
jgi:uncharacterized membrane protein YhaH (DUF805 family)